MSQTYGLACRDCRIYLTVGQRNFGPNAKPYFYGDDGLESATRDLMIAHEGHALEFGSTERFAANDYTDMDGDE